jgi:hypothetical protein
MKMERVVFFEDKTTIGYKGTFHYTKAVRRNIEKEYKKQMKLANKRRVK